MKKKILIMVVIILIIVIVVSLSILAMKQDKDNTKSNTLNIVAEDNKISDKKMYDELEVQNTKIEKEGDQTNFTFTIKNNKQEK